MHTYELPGAFLRRNTYILLGHTHTYKHTHITYTDHIHTNTLETITSNSVTVIIMGTDYYTFTVWKSTYQTA